MKDKDILKLNIIIAIKNICSLIVFMILAIIFHKWWIIFFSILFYTFIDTKEDKKDIE